MSRVGASTRRADRRALVDAGKRYHAAKHAIVGPRSLWRFVKSALELLRLAESYAITERPQPLREMARDVSAAVTA